MDEPKSKYGWTWPLNMKQAHYFPEGHKGTSLCGKVMYWGTLFKLGNDQSPDNCEQCKKKLLGNEAEVHIRIKTVFKCKRCGRTENGDTVKKKIKWGERNNYPKENIVMVSHSEMNCWCNVNGWKCPKCGASVWSKDECYCGYDSNIEDNKEICSA